METRALSFFMFNTERFVNGHASAQLKIAKSNSVAIIIGLSTHRDHRGQGHASEIMTRICRYADDRNLTLRLRVQPYLYSDMDEKRLRDFYSRFGFESINKLDMQRNYKNVR